MNIEIATPNLLTHSILDSYGGEYRNSLDLIYSLGNEGPESFEPNYDSQSFYYDINSLNSVSSLSKSFSIFSLNVQSIRAKIDAIRIFLNDLLSNGTSFDVLCFQETWLDNNADLDQVKINGYKLIHRPKSCSAHGGLAIYLRNHYTFDIFQESSTDANWEGLFIKIKLEFSHLIIGNVYRPPDNHNNILECFTENFCDLLNLLNQNNLESVVAGDFNVNLLQVNERPLFRDFADSVVSCGFVPKIIHPTRFTDTRGTLLDNFFCKLSPNHTKTLAGIMINVLSDHQGCFLSIDSLSRIRMPDRYITITKKVPDYNEKVFEYITNADLVNRINNNSNLSENYEVLVDTLKGAIIANTETKRVRINKYKQKKTPWITIGLLNSIKSRDKLYKRLKQSKPDTALFADLKTNLSTFNKILKKIIRAAKSSYYVSKFNQCRNDVKRTWQSINEVMMRGGNPNDEEDLPSQINLDGITYNDNASVANALNKHFSTIGNTISNSFINSNNVHIPQVSYKDYLNYSMETEFSFRPITVFDVEGVINDLKNKSTTSGDGISSSLLKALKPIIVQPISTIFNQSLATSSFPDSLKIARVKALFKKGDRTDPGNYRPISILPSISKIFEKLLLKQLYTYFTENSLLFNHQYGFRKAHSTEHAVLELIDRVVNDMDKGANPFSIFIDLSKAFDCLDHDILLDKLKFYGLSENAVLLLRNYLSNRKQYISYNNNTSSSDMANINIGVPQGSILGPFLFLVYMNDFHHSSEIFNMVNYADDTTLLSTINFFTNHPARSIDSELLKVSTWLHANKMKINVSKTKVLFYSPLQKSIHPPTITLNNEVIERVDHFCYLGIVIDQHLSWKLHISKISRKISKVLGVLSRLKNFLPCYVLKTIYTSLIACHLNYGILLWGGKTDSIFKLQKRAVRIITKSPKLSHTDPIFIDLKLLKVHDIYRIQMYKFAFKLFNSQLPAYFLNGFITFNRQSHLYNTRRRNRLSTPRFRHEFYRQLLRYQLIDTINSLPSCIHDKIFTHSLNGFTIYSKNHLLLNYSRECTIQNCYICRRNTRH